MRKFIFILPFVVLAAISCSKDIDTIDNPSEDRVTLRIKIKNILNVETKGLNYSADYLAGDIKGVLLKEDGQVYETFEIRNGAPYNKKVYLNSESLSLYTVWNQREWSVDDFTAVPISIESQIDYLYGTPATGINKYNPDAEISLQHCLTAVKMELSKGNYAGEGNISKLYIKSPGLGTSGKLNAITGEVYDIQGLNENILLAENFDIDNRNRISEYLLVPSGDNSKITFIVEMDGEIFEAQTEEMTLQHSVITNFKLKFSSQEMGSITINGETMTWGYNDHDTLDAK